MAVGLEILLLDDHLEPDRVLSEFLLLHCRRVHAARSVNEAIAATERRRRTGGAYHLVIANLTQVATDGLALLRELVRNGDTVPVVLTADYHAIDGALAAEAQRLGAQTILDRPIDLNQVDELLLQIQADARDRGAESAAPPPELRREGAPVQGSAGYHALPLAAQPEALERRQHPAATPLPARPLHPTPPPPPPISRPVIRSPAPLGSTSRIRRSVGPMPTPLPGPSGAGGLRVARPPTALPPTARSLGGATPRPPPPPAPQARDVRCGACGGLFRVSLKPVSYTTVCLHCGQMLRIEPG